MLPWVEGEVGGDLVSVMRQVVGKALARIEERFEDESRDPLAYHNSQHTRMVIENVVMIMQVVKQSSEREALTDRDIVLAVIAAAGHDLVQEGTVVKKEEEVREGRDGWLRKDSERLGKMKRKVLKKQ